MNHCVPDFATEEEYSIIPTYSDLTRRKNLPMAGQDEIMELFWQNGELVIQSHNQIPLKKPRNGGDAVVTAEREIRSEEEQLTSQPFIEEDEMASWLQYPMDETSFYTDFYPDLGYPALRPLSSYKPASASDLTVVDSNEAPAAAAPPSRASLVAGIPAEVPSAAASSAAGGFLSTMGSTSGESGASASAEPSPKSPEPKEERKRKGGEDNRNMGCQSVDVERELPDPKKHIHQSTSIKRSRAAEVHNLSERRRRDRINEKMKALQDLIPHCNKTDKASMLEDAIEYLKSLQLQLQMMSIGCGMVPMMYPGVQQYMAAMGMGSGMAVEMGMNRPILPYPTTVAASALPTPAAVAHLDPRFPVPAFQMHPVPLRNQSKPMLNMHCAQIQNQPQIPNFPNPYQHCSGLQQTQVPLAQIFVRNQAVKQENSSCRVENRDDPRSG